MRWLQVLVAMGLVAGGGGLGLVADGLRATPRTPPGPASLLGGFSALAVQVLTFRASDAAARGDPAGALLQYDLVMELEPQLLGAADWIALEVGAAMAGDEPDPGSRWGLVVEGLRIHDRCVAANPGVARALTNRGKYVLLRFAIDPERSRRFQDAFGRTAFEAAYQDLGAALALDPGSVEALDLVGVAAVHSGRELLFAGDESAAQSRLTEAQAALTAAYEIYRAGGLTVASKAEAIAYCEQLLGLLTVRGAERDALYRTLHARFGGPSGMPGLPPPEAE